MSKFKKKLVAKDIFQKSRENSPNEKMIVEEFNNKLNIDIFWGYIFRFRPGIIFNM